MNQDMRDVEYLSSVFMPETFRILTTISEITIMVLGWFGKSLLVFTRWGFGERFLTWTGLGLMYTVMGIFDLLQAIPAMLRGMVPFSNPPEPDHLSPWFWQVAILLYVIHILFIWHRNGRNIQWHSMSFGVSWLSLLPWGLLARIPVVGRHLVIDDWFLYRWVEPSVAFAAGVAVKDISPATGLWIQIASVALFIGNQMSYFSTRSRILDLSDARIEAAYISGTLQGQSKRETGGFSTVVVPSGNPTFKSNPDIQATVRDTLRSVDLAS